MRYTFDPRYNSKAKDEKLFEFVEKAKIDYLVGMPNVKLNLSSDRKVAWLSNFTFDDYDEIKWHYDKELPSHALLIRKDGKKVIEKEVEIKSAGELATIDEPIHGLETMQLIF